MKHAKPARRNALRRSKSNGGTDRIYGIHAAAAALANPRRQIRAVHVTKNAGNRLASALSGRGIRPATVSPEALSARLGRETSHQGVLVEAAPLPAPALETLWEDGMPQGPVILLDQVTDPQNVGAILRSAAAFGAAALVMTKRHSPPLDGGLAKAASGALEHVPVISVANLARALDALGKHGIERIGLDSDAQQTLEATDLSMPCALVLGAEHKGLRRLTRQHCDHLCRLSTSGPIASLNVSSAAAVALHVITAQRLKPDTAGHSPASDPARD